MGSGCGWMLGFPRRASLFTSLTSRQRTGLPRTLPSLLILLRDDKQGRGKRKTKGPSVEVPYIFYVFFGVVSGNGFPFLLFLGSGTKMYVCSSSPRRRVKRCSCKIETQGADKNVSCKARSRKMARCCWCRCLVPAKKMTEHPLIIDPVSRE